MLTNYFDLLRFLLAFSVIICHCYAIILEWEQFIEIESFIKWSASIFPNVLLFAVLSWKVVESPALKLKKIKFLKL